MDMEVQAIVQLGVWVCGVCMACLGVLHSHQLLLGTKQGTVALMPIRFEATYAFVFCFARRAVLLDRADTCSWYVNSK
jgi:hypothetical protein